MISFLYYPTLTLSFLAKARRPEKRRQHQTKLGKKYFIDLCLPLLLSLYRSLGGNQSEKKAKGTESEQKITRMREDNAQEQDKYYCIYITINRVSRGEETLRRALSSRWADSCLGMRWPGKFPHSTPHASGLTSPEDALGLSSDHWLRLDAWYNIVHYCLDSARGGALYSTLLSTWSRKRKEGAYPPLLGLFFILVRCQMYVCKLGSDCGFNVVASINLQPL